MTGPELALAGIAGTGPIEQAPVAIVVTDVDGVIVTWNRQAELLFGYSAAEAVGHTSAQLSGDRVEPAVVGALRSSVRAGVPWNGDVAAVRKDGTRIGVHILTAPITDADGNAAGTISVALGREGDADVQPAQMRLELLLQASELLARSLDPEAGLQGVARLAASWLADVCAIDLLDGDAGMRRVAVADADRARAPLSERLRAFPPDPDGFNMTAALREGRTEILPELTDEVLRARLNGPRHIEAVRGIDARSAVILPLAARGRTLGVMLLLVCGGRAPFGPDDIAVAEELARRTAVAVDNAVLLREARERADAAQRLQRLSDAALSHVDLDDLLDEILALLRRELESDSAAVLLMEPNGLELTVRATDGLGLAGGRGLVVAADDPSVAAPVTAGAPIVVHDPNDDESGPLLRNRGVHTLMAAPLRVGPRTVGVLETDWLAPRPLGQDEVDLIGLAAGRIALAVDRAQAYQAEQSARMRLELLARTSDVLGESLDFHAALGDLAHVIVPHLADWCAVDVVEANGSHSISVAHSDPAKVELARELVRRYPPDPDDAVGASVVRRGGDDVDAGMPAAFLERAARDDEHRAILRGLGMRSVIVVPLTARGRTHGTLTLVAAESGRMYGDDDLAFATELARRAATAIDTARLYQDRDQVARTLQRSLLPPDLPDVPGLELAAVYHPAGGGGDVGGDFYDAFETGERSLFLAIGDVCGKGPHAAALTGIARHTVRAAAVREHSPRSILRTLNQALLRQAVERRFCTVAIGRLEIAPGGGSARLTVCCGGHPPPLLIRRDGAVEEAGTPGTLLGIYEQVQLSDLTVELRAGDAVVFHTDGVTEERLEGHMFGEHRLVELLRTSAGMSAAGIADRIERAVLDFNPGPPADDVAVIVLRLTGNE
ncbi:MAG TPA: SpoIIE family protein phosphatase [Gaiellales bacterium]|jgi:PAS domain S-box-containing protein